MTHDELLAKIDKHEHTIVIGGVGSEIEVLRLMEFRNALRAVVEFHKPVAVLTGNGTGTIYYNQGKLQCIACHGEYNKPGATYPCETYLIIEKELG